MTFAIRRRKTAVPFDGLVKASGRQRIRNRFQIEGHFYRLTNKARGLLGGPVIVNDCSAKCTCGGCVMRRLRRSRKLAR